MPCYNDYYNNYSGSKDMAEYIEKMNYEDEEIYAFGYRCVSIEPYFNKLIFKNWNDTIHRWSINNTNFYEYTNFETIDKSKYTNRPKLI